MTVPQEFLLRAFTRGFGDRGAEQVGYGGGFMYPKP